MLDYYFTSEITQEERISSVVKKIIEEVPPIIKKYKLKDFDLDTFMEDIRGYFKKIDWLKE